MINLTTQAAEQALRMMQENDIDPATTQYGLRVGIKAGGCSGLNYVLDIVDAPDAADRTWVLHGVRVYCDPKSYLYLNGTEIDFEQNMMGGGFKFTNPNAKRSCGCGTSFAV
ncbi:MAG: iron-sulfur cluster assembly accessory protein [Myxococcota bacterium]